MSLFDTKENSGLAKNLCYAVAAQGAAFASSIVMSLVVPKILGVESYAYWQMFVLYASYTGICLFGIKEGMYLRLGGKRYGELDKGELKAQLSLVTMSQLCMVSVCVPALFSSGADVNHTFVFLAVIASGLIQNIFTWLSYMFQSVNLTHIASICALINKVLFLPSLIVFVVLGVESFIPLLVADLASQVAALIYCLICARKVLCAKMGSMSAALACCVIDARAGIKIMLAHYADTFIVGFTRMLTNWNLGLSVFGKLSFSFSLINFALVFIEKFAMVVFPVLKRLGGDSQREKFKAMHTILHCFLPLIFLAYVPAFVILGWWLPDYRESLSYLALVLPLCFYSCKAGILFNTYLKMSRDEMLLCIVNVAAMLLNGLFSLIAIVLVGSVELAAVGIVVTVLVRDSAFERIMCGRYRLSLAFDCIAEGALSIGFMSCSWFMGAWSFLPLILFVAVYWFCCRNQLLSLLQTLLCRFNSAR